MEQVIVEHLHSVDKNILNLFDVNFPYLFESDFEKLSLFDQIVYQRKKYVKCVNGVDFNVIKDKTFVNGIQEGLSVILSDDDEYEKVKIMERGKFIRSVGWGEIFLYSE